MQRPLDEIVDKIKREKVSMIVEVIRRNRAMEGVLQLFAETPVLTNRSRLDCDTALLEALVKDNILYYDPVDGVCGVQGRSLEWGRRGYFEEPS